MIFEHLHRFSAALWYDFHDRCLEYPSLRYSGRLHLGTRVVIAMIFYSERDRFLFPRVILEQNHNKTMKPSVQLEPLPVYSFLVSKRGGCVALRSIARLFQVASVLSNAMGLLHLDIHVFLESRLVTLNI